jgi:hypothetical protein
MRAILNAKQWAYRGIVAASFVLCTATVIQWIRSYYVIDAIGYQTSTHAPDAREVNGMDIWHEHFIGLIASSGICAFAIDSSIFPFPTDGSPGYASTLSRPHIPGLKWRRSDPNAGGWKYVLDDRGQYFGFFIDWSPARPYNFEFEGQYRLRVVGVPHWFLCLLFAGPGAAWFVRRRKLAIESFRLRRGLCARCGYDLRATKDRCPECGTEVPVLRF